MKKYIHTDLAMERDRPSGRKGYCYEETDLGLCKRHTLTIRTAGAAKAMRCQKGLYHTLAFPPLTMLGDEERREISHQLSLLLQEMATAALGVQDFTEQRILIVGLGNRQQTVDAIGPLSAERIHATAQLPADLRQKLLCAAIAVFSPGVRAQSGMGSEELILAAVRQFRPALVILIDALTSRSLARIGTVVQLTDSGIAPGSGTGAHRAELHAGLLGCPTLAIGCPTVTDTATLLQDLLTGSQHPAKLPRGIHKQLLEIKGCLVCPQEADTIVRHAATILADAVNRAFGVPDL